MSALSQIADMLERQRLEQSSLPKEYSVQVTLFEYQGRCPKAIWTISSVLGGLEDAKALFECTKDTLRKRAETVEIDS